MASLLQRVKGVSVIGSPKKLFGIHHLVDDVVTC